ncbi:MAG: Dickkopf N-terminal cysteine-rich domain-containing protein [Betaproteobacteria bacterium]
MNRYQRLFAATSLLLASVAHANLCDSVKDNQTSADTRRDVDLYEEMFPDAAYQGNRHWNELILECNRQRDTKGNEVARVTAASGDNPDKRLLRSRNLEPRVIRGHYNFFGNIVTQLKYVYVLSRQDGVWTMIIPYRPIINDVVPGRIDFYVGSRRVDPDTGAVANLDTANGHAGVLYDEAQVADPASSAQIRTLKAGAQSIDRTLCTSTTYFPGKDDKYDGKNDADSYRRDKENRFISLGRIQYRYDKNLGAVHEGCRVDASRELYWRWDPNGNQAVKVKPGDWILDNFVRTAEAHWTIPGVFRLKLLMQGRNDASFPKSTLDLLQDDDHLTVRFATKFLPYDFNQMYKSNVIQFNNFSTMTSDGTYWHEVGHAFGLDDEYGKSKYDDKTGDTDYKDNGCESDIYRDYSPTDYQMCEAGAPSTKSIYDYIAVSRYVTKQSECDDDQDCASAEYCDKGVITIGRNQCVAQKADNATCDLAGGAHQCRSGRCNLSRCFTPDSVAMGGTCYVDAACKGGKCSAVDGTKGTCVCKDDPDCDSGSYCNAGADFTKNSCVPLKRDNAACDVVGGGHQCKSGQCRFARCYTPESVAMGGICYNDDACKVGKCSAVDGAQGVCVCQSDSDCGAGKWCDAGLDAKINSCRAKLGKGAVCGKAGSVGNDHKCRSGQCSGLPNYKCK